MNRCRRTGGWSRATPFFRFVQARKGARVDFRGHRRRRYTALVLVLTFVSGCLSPPRRASETMVNPPMARVSSEVPAHVDEAGLLSADLWKQSGDLNPQAVLVPGRRVVVTEFDVEFVSYQFQACKRQQLIIDPKVHPLELIGMGRRYTPMTEEDQQALASELYGAFLQDLRRRGLELVSQDDLHASPGYAELPKESVVRSSPLMFLNMLGSDTGTVLQTRTVAAPGLSILQGSLGGSMRAPGFLESRAPGLGVLQGGPQARTAAEARILQETRGGRGPRRAAASRHLPRAACPRAPQRGLLDHSRGIDDTAGLSFAGLGPRGNRYAAIPTHRRANRTGRIGTILRRADGDATQVHRPGLGGVETVMRAVRAAVAVRPGSILP